MSEQQQNQAQGEGQGQGEAPPPDATKAPSTESESAREQSQTEQIGDMLASSANDLGEEGSGDEVDRYIENGVTEGPERSLTGEDGEEVVQTQEAQEARQSQKDQEEESVREEIVREEQKGQPQEVAEKQEGEEEVEEGEEPGDATELQQLRERQQELEAENARLKTRNTLSDQEKQVEDQAQEGQKEREEPQQRGEEEPQETEVEILEFVTEDEFEEALDNRENLNRLLTRVAVKTQEQMMRQIPDLVAQTAQRQSELDKSISSFWEDNSDLVEHQDYVAFVANQVQSENPDASYDAVLEETGKRVRSELNVAKKAEEVEEERKEKEQQKQEKKPAFAGGKPRGTRGGQGDNRTGQQKQIDHLVGMDN